MATRPRLTYIAKYIGGELDGRSENRILKKGEKKNPVIISKPWWDRPREGSREVSIESFRRVECLYRAVTVQLIKEPVTIDYTYEPQL